jgi:hypothetical protein
VDWGRAEGLEEEEERVGRRWWYADGLLDGGTARNEQRRLCSVSVRNWRTHETRPGERGEDG